MRFYIFFMTLIFLVSCNGVTERPKEEKKIPLNKEKKISGLNKSRRLPELTKLEFKTKIIDLGNFWESDTTLKGHFIFVNTGKSPLLIEYVNPECTCTNFEFTKEKILPGNEGFIDLFLNITNKTGSQKLYTVVKANTEDKFYKLTLKINILEK